MENWNKSLRGRREVYGDSLGLVSLVLSTRILFFRLDETRAFSPADHTPTGARGFVPGCKCTMDVRGSH